MTQEDVASIDVGVNSVRLPLDNVTTLDKLGLLSELAGTWQGTGFNLIARPDFHDKADTYLQLNQTRETLKFEPINAPIPNRGFGQEDIDLFGLTYLQQIIDVSTGGLLHVEPGVWIRQPEMSYPPEKEPPNGNIVARLGSIPHGTSILAQGSAVPFTGPPTLKTPTAEYAFSEFPSFNSSSFIIGPAPIPPGQFPQIIHAAGSSEKLSTPVQFPFPEYDLSVPEGVLPHPEAFGLPPGSINARTPFRTSPPEPPLPTQINGVPIQEVVNDPIKLLQAVIKKQVADGNTFEGVALNIASQAEITFFKNANSHVRNNDPTVTVKVFDGAGDLGNIPFLEGGEPVGTLGPNAESVLFYATFWIEKVHRPIFPPFKQLQYAQMVLLNFEVINALPAKINVSWPHISVATLRQGFL